MLRRSVRPLYGATPCIPDASGNAGLRRYLGWFRSTSGQLGCVPFVPVLPLWWKTHTTLCHTNNISVKMITVADLLLWT